MSNNMKEVLEQLLREKLKESTRHWANDQKHRMLVINEPDLAKRLQIYGAVTLQEAQALLAKDEEEKPRSIRLLYRWIDMGYVDYFKAKLNGRIRTVVLYSDIKKSAAARDFYQSLNMTASRRDKTSGGANASYSILLQNMVAELKDINEEVEEELAESVSL